MMLRGELGLRPDAKRMMLRTTAEDGEKRVWTEAGCKAMLVQMKEWRFYIRSISREVVLRLDF